MILYLNAYGRLRGRQQLRCCSSRTCDSGPLAVPNVDDLYNSKQCDVRCAIVTNLVITARSGHEGISRTIVLLVYFLGFMVGIALGLDVNILGCVGL